MRAMEWMDAEERTTPSGRGGLRYSDWLVNEEFAPNNEKVLPSKNYIHFGL